MSKYVLIVVLRREELASKPALWLTSELREGNRQTCPMVNLGREGKQANLPDWSTKLGTGRGQ